MLLPDLLLDEIFMFLGRGDVRTLRSASHEFYRLSLPILLRVHTLKEVRNGKYVDFLKRNGKLVKGLIIEEFNDFLEFQGSGLTLMSTFPNIRSVSLEKVCTDWGAGLAEFCNQCVKLKHLKHLSLDKWGEDESFYGLAAVVRKLDSLYVDFYPHKILENQQEYRGLKRLLMPVELYYFFGTLKDFSFPELWLIDANIPMICSKPNDESSHRWLECAGVGAKCYLKLPCDNQSFGLTKLLKNSMIYPIFPDTFYLTGSYDAYVDIGSTPNFAQHCTIILKDTHRVRHDLFSPIRDIPSLDIISKVKLSFFRFSQQTFMATSLSLSFDDHDSFEALTWTLNSFPELRHFYVANTFPDEMLPLADDAFPNLTHFYSNVYQSEKFWAELLRAAPKLLYVHTDTIQTHAMEFEGLKPKLRLKPYQNILKVPNTIYGKSGFNRCLMH